MALLLLTFSFFSVVQLCVTLCDSMDYSSPGSSAHGFLQARILEWVAIPFSKRFSLHKDWTRVSCIVSRFFTIWITCYLIISVCKVLSVMSNSATIWTAAHHAPLSIKFFRQDILEWVAISSSKGSSWPRDQACISCFSSTGRRILDHWAT